jgi:hypothetical protein
MKQGTVDQQSSLFEQALQSTTDIRQLIQDCVQLSHYSSNTKASDVCEVHTDVAADVSQCIQTIPVLVAAALQCAITVLLKYAQPHMTVS